MTTTPEQATAKGWMPDDSTFGARLALVRQRMGWGNVKEAAIECGVPAESWRTWERDGVEPRRLVEMSSLIAGRTGCDLGWLIAGRMIQQQVASPEAPERRPRRPRSVKHLYVSLRRSDEHEEHSDVPARPFGPSRPGPARPASAVPPRSRRPQPTRPGVRPMSR